MYFKKTMFALTLGSVAAMQSMSAHAWDLNAGDRLTITTGVDSLDSSGNIINVSSGSYFALDANADSKIQGTEKKGVSEGTTGITIGRSNTAPGEITAPYIFYSEMGHDWVSSPITGGTGGLDMSGWVVTWDGIPPFTMNSGAWGTGYADGVANFVWDGNYGSSYTLDYHATIPPGHPSGFGFVKYELHLEGTVQAVPEASTYGMMLAGLGLMGFATKRRKRTKAYISG